MNNTNSSITENERQIKIDKKKEWLILADFLLISNDQNKQKPTYTIFVRLRICIFRYCDVE